jgi:hypothetical protein
VSARHVRPQVARAWSLEDRARSLAQVMDVGEPLAATLLVALHVGERRDLMAAFLDAAGIAHENGVLKDEGATLSVEGARRGAAVLRAGWPAEQVDLYLNTLWLQDPERWRALEAAAS